jgi:hypothetical protein
LNEKNPSIGSNYLKSAVRLFKYYKTLGEKAILQVKEEEIHWQPDPLSNSIAIIFKHMSGNMLSRWTDFLTTDGEKPWRARDSEFLDDTRDMESLLSCWEKGWNCLFSVLEGLSESDLGKIIYIRNEGHTVLEAINRQLTHCTYHVGQVVHIAKSMRGDCWQSLSVPRGASAAYNREKFSKPRRRKHFT